MPKKKSAKKVTKKAVKKAAKKVVKKAAKKVAKAPTKQVVKKPAKPIAKKPDVQPAELPDVPMRVLSSNKPDSPVVRSLVATETTRSFTPPNEEVPIGSPRTLPGYASPKKPGGHLPPRVVGEKTTGE